MRISSNVYNITTPPLLPPPSHHHHSHNHNRLPTYIHTYKHNIYIRWCRMPWHVNDCVCVCVALAIASLASWLLCCVSASLVFHRTRARPSIHPSVHYTQSVLQCARARIIYSSLMRDYLAISCEFWRRLEMAMEDGAWTEGGDARKAMPCIKVVFSCIRCLLVGSCDFCLLLRSTVHAILLSPKHCACLPNKYIYIYIGYMWKCGALGKQLL